jgi:hypothetical protein
MISQTKITIQTDGPLPLAGISHFSPGKVLIFTRKFLLRQKRSFLAGKALHFRRKSSPFLRKISPLPG